MANKLLQYDQDEQLDTDIWDSYFNWKLTSSNPSLREYDTAFMEFLKISLSRPRDIQRILKLQQDIMKRHNKGNKLQFSYEIYNSDEFQNLYSEYFLSSLKDQLSFYYSETDFTHFKKGFLTFSQNRSFHSTSILKCITSTLIISWITPMKYPNSLKIPRHFCSSYMIAMLLRQ